MMPPTLLVQGFQRAFVDITGPTFSVSASMRRSTCEEVLKFARSAGWSVIHAYLDAAETSDAAAALDGFSPWPGEAYVRQKTLSPFRCAALESKLGELRQSPVYLISFAGVGVIGATFFDALELGVPLQLISNGIADAGRTKLSERKSLAALEAMAQAFNRSVHWPDLLDSEAKKQPTVRPQLPRPVASQCEPINRRAQDLTALLLLAQYLLDQIQPYFASSGPITRLLEDTIAELELEIDRPLSSSGDWDDSFIGNVHRP